MRAALLTAFILTATAAAQTPAPTSPPHLKAFEGQYKPESIQYDGKEMADPKTKAALTLVIKDGEYRAYFAHDPSKDSHVRLFTATLAADTGAKTFELTVTDGPKKGEKRHGLYKLEAGKLTICYGPAEKPRPTAFTHHAEQWPLLRDVGARSQEVT